VTDVMGHFSFTELMLLQALGARPTALQVKIVDAVMVTIMEHGLVPSAVATRLTHYGAPESFQGAVVAGLLGVGDRYAGTASECGAVLERMVAAPPDQRRAIAVEELNRYRAMKRPVPGFGHPIHQALDPRVERLVDIVRGTGAAGEYIDAMYLLQDTLRETLGKPLVTNISAAMGAVMAEAGVPSGMMRGVVLTARCAGLVGHLWEEMRQPAAPAIWAAAQAAVDYQPE
jgi:citrate synthase